MLTLVTPSRLSPVTRDALRFPLRNKNLKLLQLGEERSGSDPVRLSVGRLDHQFFTNQHFIEIQGSSVLWVEPEDRVAVSLINEVLEWCDDASDDENPRGLMVKRALEVDGEVWREQLIPRAWNAAAQAHLVAGNPWYEIKWSCEKDVRVVTEVSASVLDEYEPDFLTESEERLISQTLFFLILGAYDTVVDFTEIKEDVSLRPATWSMLKTARAEAFRYLGQTQDAADLSMSVIQSDEDYPHAWFVFGCAALELNEFVRATGAFRRAEKASSSISFELYQECSIWEWQALLGTLFARVAMGDIEGVKSRMARVFEEVPPHLAQRLTSELTGALLGQNEVMLAWEIVETKLAKDAIGTVPSILQIGEYYVRQEGRKPAYNWLLRLSSSYGELLRDYGFVDVLYELSIAVNDPKTTHELLWVLLEFEQTPASVYEKLARDLLSRGRVEEAREIEQKRKAVFSDEDK